MCDLTIEQPLNTITSTQINEMTTAEIKQSIEHGMPNYLTLKNLAIELASRCSPIKGNDPVNKFLDLAQKMESEYPFLYVEIAHTRTTNWMVWLCTHNKDTNPNRKVLVSTQGATAEEACRNALNELIYREASK